jgi:quercetin dioxygenase-like cupin family protein
MKLIKNTTGKIDMRGSMYPCMSEKIYHNTKVTDPYSTIYGFVLEGTVSLPNGWIASKHQYFCYSTTEVEEIKADGTAVIITRLGFIGQRSLGGPLENSGRLCYIDGCSDSLLVFPPRMGDPSLNLLCFPPGIDQSFHIHPSIRLGIVVSGKGKACLLNEELDLEPGNIFCIEEREYHRFTTQDSSMSIVAFHPDGDWGPTDQNHTMLNRTYILNK